LIESSYFLIHKITQKVLIHIFPAHRQRSPADKIGISRLTVKKLLLLILSKGNLFTLIL